MTDNITKPATALPDSNKNRTMVWSELEDNLDSIFCHHTITNETHVPTHIHNRGQLIYSEGGRVYITVDQKIWYLPARHYMWIPAGKEHSLDFSSPAIFLWNIYFPIWKNEADFFRKAAVYPVNNLLLELIYFSKNWYGHITRENESRYALLSGIKAVLPEISKHSLPFDLPIPKDPKLKKITDYLQVNLSGNLTLPEITGLFDMSESTITRLFKKELKMSFINYLCTLRIIRAIELLSQKNTSIKEICFEVGYESVPTFSNIFKKVVGVRPSVYLTEFNNK